MQLWKLTVNDLADDEQILMNRALKNAIKSTLRQFNVAIARYDELQIMAERSRVFGRLGNDLKLILKIREEDRPMLLDILEESKAQLRQDIFVLSEVAFKRNGFFVEFGATNGIHLSNTYLLEKRFGWTGILAEPANVWRKDLVKNRTSKIETLCVWSGSNEKLKFNETDWAELSTVSEFQSNDSHNASRVGGKSYEVQTISLNDLLSKHGAPREIDYLSVDTEGSEYEILKNLDFGKYQFKVITCEHNYTLMREKILNLLNSHGYRRTFEDVSEFDDWYVRA